MLVDVSPGSFTCSVVARSQAKYRMQSTFSIYREYTCTMREGGEQRVAVYGHPGSYSVFSVSLEVLEDDDMI